MSHQEPVAANTYFDRHLNMEAVKILPGEYFATTRDLVVVTVLGSCVSVCLRDRRSGIGGMNHFMLPGNDEHSPVSMSARYGVYAMEMLTNQLLKLGADRRQFEAKIFGGANVLSGLTMANVGPRNAQFVTDYLVTERIPIVASSLLDIYPRKVYFFPASGRVLLKTLRQLHNSTLLEREAEYSLRIRQQRGGGDVDLF